MVAKSGPRGQEPRGHCCRTELHPELLVPGLPDSPAPRHKAPRFLHLQLEREWGWLNRTAAAF